MIEFIFVGRLAEEKGVDMLLEVFERLIKDFPGKFKVYIFGDGVLHGEVERFSKKYEAFSYYGHRPKKEIFEVRKKCTYTLVPSTFLETFGLTALDSISLGVPVIGFDKGGLSQFLNEKGVLKSGGSKSETVDLMYQKIKKIISGYDQKTWNEESLYARKIYEKYTRDARLKRFKEYSGLKEGSRVALISDYGKDIGGLENWIILMSSKLQEAGYEVKLIGGVDTYPSNFKKLCYLIGTVFNYRAGLRIRKKVVNFGPDLIWYHSVHRVLGWFPLWLLKGASRQQWIMYHDFGLFHPYPSGVYDEQQLDRARSFVGYMKEAWKVSPLSALLQCCKFFQRGVMFRVINMCVKRHLVPSSYLLKKIKPYCTRGDTLCLPHFILSKDELGER